MSASITADPPIAPPLTPTTPNPTPPATSTNSASTTSGTDSNALTNMDKWSIAITFGAAVLMVIIAIICARNGWWIGIAAAMGALGGLVHEIAQSGGTILRFERKADGFYIGAMAGAVLGAIAGLMTIRGILVDGAAVQPKAVQLAYEALLAGIALKGVTEAAGGAPVPEGSKSLTPAKAIEVEATANN